MMKVGPSYKFRTLYSNVCISTCLDHFFISLEGGLLNDFQIFHQPRKVVHERPCFQDLLSAIPDSFRGWPSTVSLIYRETTHTQQR